MSLTACQKCKKYVAAFRVKTLSVYVHMQHIIKNIYPLVLFESARTVSAKYLPKCCTAENTNHLHFGWPEKINSNFIFYELYL